MPNAAASSFAVCVVTLILLLMICESAVSGRPMICEFLLRPSSRIQFIADVFAGRKQVVYLGTCHSSGRVRLVTVDDLNNEDDGSGVRLPYLYHKSPLIVEAKCMLMVPFPFKLLEP